MATTRKPLYGSSGGLTITLASLATSATLVVGRESASVDNSSNQNLDDWIAGVITVGTTPTVNTQIEIWVIARRDDTTWPDVFAGADAGRTVTSRDTLSGSGRLGALITIPVATSNIGYPFEIGSVAALFGGFMPKAYSVFVTHSTAVALNATGANQVVSRTGLQETFV